MKAEEFTDCMKGLTRSQLLRVMEGVKIFENFMPCEIKQAYKLKNLRILIGRLIKEKGGKR